MFQSYGRNCNSSFSTESNWCTGSLTNIQFHDIFPVLDDNLLIEDLQPGTTYSVMVEARKWNTYFEEEGTSQDLFFIDNF